MTRFAIDRKNRDRKGGHSTTALSSSQWKLDVLDPGTRKRFKRMGTKLLRRQHNKAINLGLKELAQEQEDRFAAYWVLQSYLDYDSSENLRQYDEEAKNYPDYTDDEYYSHYDNDPYYNLEGSDPYDNFEDIGCGDPYCGFCSEGSMFDADYRSVARVQPRTEVVNRAIAWTTDPHFNAELEIIENKDAGKSLGQLLRERLSRPF